MIKTVAPLSIALFSLTLLLVGCSEDVSGSCPTGESLNPISEECEPIRCGSGETVNPITGECQGSGDGGTGDGGTGDGGTGDGGTGDGGTGDGGTGDGGTGDGGTGDGGTGDGGTGDGSTGDSEPYDPLGDYEPYQPQDPGDAVYHSCESSDFDGIEQPNFAVSSGGNYVLATSPSAEISSVTLPSSSHHAHFIEHADDGYSGFIISTSPRSGQTTPQHTADWLFDTVSDIPGYQTTREGHGLTYQAHDYYSGSILNHVSITTDDAPGVVRDNLVGRIFGIAASDLSYDLDDEAPADGSGVHLTYKTLWRSDSQVIIVGGITTGDLQAQHDSNARFAIQDLAGGTALALAGETMTDECVSLELTDSTEIDIIISLDASGSMSDVQNSLAGFADDLVDILNASGVDWRVGVTGVDCDEIREDDALSHEFRALWPDPDDWDGGNFPIPFPGMEDFDTPCRNPDGLGGIGGGDNNGRLMNGTFTTSAQEISDRMGMVSTTGLEYTLTMGIAAIDHSLPRANNDPSKIRSNAAVVVIAVTDENEQLFKDAFSWIQGENHSISSSERAEMEAFIDPWLGYLHRPDIGATVFGLYWVPGTECEGGIDVAHGIHHVVEQTGGHGDSICSPDITDSFTEITNASLDITTGLRLIGNPLGSSVTVDVVDVSDQSVSPLPRSISDGFDFDSTQSSLYFEGPSTPEIGQRVVVPYLQWNRTIIPCSSDAICESGGKLLKCTDGICR